MDYKFLLSMCQKKFTHSQKDELYYHFALFEDLKNAIYSTRNQSNHSKIQE